MLSLMLNTDLQWRDLDLNTGKLFVRQGKGAKDRTLWLGERDVELLCRWRQRQANELDTLGTHVFSTLKGSVVSNRYAQQMVKRYSEKAGISKNVHFHALRHSLATDLHRESCSIRLVQKALDHSDVSTTMIYTHIHDDEVKSAMQQFRSVHC